jgi:transcriptional regulator with XRE-family HTH domain
MDGFLHRVRDCMAAAGLTQADLARACGISSASVSAWVHGPIDPRHLKAVPLLRAAARLRVHPLWLLTGEGERNDRAATVVHVREPVAVYAASAAPAARWPFDALPPARFFALPARTQGLIEGWVLRLLEQHDSQPLAPP